MDFTWVLSPAIALVSVGFSIFFYLKNRQVLKIEIVSEEIVPVLAVNEVVEGLSVTYKRKKVQDDLFVAKIKFKNTGNKDLELPQDDPNAPAIVVNFTETKVVDAKVSSQQASPVVEFDDTKIRIGANLLKKGEEVDAKVITLGEPNCYFHQTRIPNVQIKKRERTLVSKVWSVIWPWIITAFLFLILFLDERYQTDKEYAELKKAFNISCPYITATNPTNGTIYCSIYEPITDRLINSAIIPESENHRFDLIPYLNASDSKLLLIELFVEEYEQTYKFTLDCSEDKDERIPSKPPGD